MANETQINREIVNDNATVINSSLYQSGSETVINPVAAGTTGIVTGQVLCGKYSVVKKMDIVTGEADLYITEYEPLPIKNMSIKQWDAIMRINLKSVLLMIKHSYPLMKNNSSSIVNISSEQVYNPDELFSPYTVSKAGVNMLTISAAKEFLNDGIRVNAIALGTVKTNILDGIITSKEKQASMFESKQNSIPFGIIDISNAAKVVIFLLSEDSKYITGEVVRCDGGLFLGR